MISMLCRKCGSVNIRKNGLTGAGSQKYHCKDCGFYGTLVTQENKQREKEKLVEKLLAEGMSQRSIARSLSVTYSRIVSIKKRNMEMREHTPNRGETFDS